MQNSPIEVRKGSMASKWLNMGSIVNLEHVNILALFFPKILVVQYVRFYKFSPANHFLDIITFRKLLLIKIKVIVLQYKLMILFKRVFSSEISRHLFNFSVLNLPYSIYWIIYWDNPYLVLRDKHHPFLYFFQKLVFSHFILFKIREDSLWNFCFALWFWPQVYLFDSKLLVA